jgi:hypothetical protein
VPASASGDGSFIVVGVVRAEAGNDAHPTAVPRRRAPQSPPQLASGAERANNVAHALALVGILRNGSYFGESEEKAAGFQSSGSRMNAWCPEPESNRHALASTGF